MNCQDVECVRSSLRKLDACLVKIELVALVVAIGVAAAERYPDNAQIDDLLMALGTLAAVNHIVMLISAAESQLCMFPPANAWETCVPRAGFRRCVPSCSYHTEQCFIDAGQSSVPNVTDETKKATMLERYVRFQSVDGKSLLALSNTSEPKCRC
jgi:hypothetical protein